MKSLSWFGAALVGGLIGAAVWAAIVASFKIEIGWIALLVGALAGFGVRLASQGEEGIQPGVIAASAAIVALAVGNIASVALILRGMNTLPIEVTDDDAIVVLADVVVREKERAGETIRWPAGSSFEEAFEEADYPSDVWDEARARWMALSRDERHRAVEHWGSLHILDEEFVVSYLADEVVQEFESNGQSIDWPMPLEDRVGRDCQDHYPPDVWNEAESRWASMSDDERRQHEDFIAEANRWTGSLTSTSTVLQVAFAALSPWDGLWALLAVAAAWQVGGGSTET